MTTRSAPEKRLLPALAGMGRVLIARVSTGSTGAGRPAWVWTGSTGAGRPAWVWTGSTGAGRPAWAWMGSTGAGGPVWIASIAMSATTRED